MTATDDDGTPTPTPWTVGIWSTVEDSEGVCIAHCTNRWSPANAAHIVTCVNSHAELEAKAKLYPELVGALRELVGVQGSWIEAHREDAIAKARAVLAKVKP